MTRRAAAARLFLIAMYVTAIIVGRYFILDRSKVVTFTKSPILQGLNDALKPASGGYLPIVGKDYTIASVKYFYNGQWAVVSLKPIGASADPGTVVFLKQNGVYKGVLGPSNFFQPGDTESLPADVANYIKAATK